jgi:membrane-associated PAP2 superfamily phosphatase
MNRFDTRFWITHALLPSVALLTAFVAVRALNLDEQVAIGLFFDQPSHRWLGAGAGQWWARDLLHTGGRDAIRLVVAAALLTWALGFPFAGLRRFQGEAGYIALSMILAIGCVGALKAISNVDCPWDVQGFGGQAPYLGLFDARPESLPRAKCFPGAHSASGFALMALYFSLRDRKLRVARAALMLGLLVGCVFSFGQQARGAHFLSHDLASVAVVWWVLLGVYTARWGQRLRPADPRLPAAASICSKRPVMADQADEAKDLAQSTFALRSPPTISKVLP